MDTSDVILLIILVSITVIISIFYVIMFIILRKKYKEIYKPQKEKKSELQFNDYFDYIRGFKNLTNVNLTEKYKNKRR